MKIYPKECPFLMCLLGNNAEGVWGDNTFLLCFQVVRYNHRRHNKNDLYILFRLLCKNIHSKVQDDAELCYKLFLLNHTYKLCRFHRCEPAGHFANKR